MQRRLKTFSILIAAVVMGSFLTMGGCNLSGGDSGSIAGSIDLSLTDAPVDGDGITGVYITVEEIQHPTTDGAWQTMTGFDGPQTYNLLELTGGNSALLGTLDLPADEYEQIRFILTAPDEDEPFSGGNPGSWVNMDDNEEYNEDVDEALFAPSAAQSGYKATADQPFVVPENGTISLTADFDVRKALVDTNNSVYILKPVLRIVADNQAGEIAGTITNNSGSDSLVVYAYENNAFSSDEPNSGDNGFSNAVTSFTVKDDGTYTLAYLAEGTYDLVVAQYDSNGEYVDGSGDAVDKEDVEVTAGESNSGINFSEEN